MSIKYLFFLAALWPSLAAWADDGLTYRVEAQATMSGSGDNTPLWLNGNKYGLSSLSSSNGYLRAALERPLAADSLRQWGVGYGVDVAAAYNNTSSFIVQQAYVEGRWRKSTLLLGSKELPLEMKNQELSTGSQVLGINARPIPQIRLAYPDYVDVPLTARWVQFKGHLAFGRFTDDGWQKDFTDQKSQFTEDVLFHSKAGFLKVGKPGGRFSAEAGMEMACQFGGTAYQYIGGKLVDQGINSLSLKSFIRAFVPGGNDRDDQKPDQPYKGAEGNHLGAWLVRLNYELPTWAVHLYGEHYFEDLSGMFQLDYDNYTTGSKWMEKHGHRFLLYDFKDMLLGVELNLKQNDWLNSVVLEYIHTKYQSGPIYFDHQQYLPDHIGGKDGYYQHGIYTGWQHWGQVIGNPLYRSPLYNTNGAIQVQDNRFYAWHLGLSGDPLPGLHYRLLGTVQKGFGTYGSPFDDPQCNVSLLAEAAYQLPDRMAKGWGVKCGVGYDHGGLLGNNLGVQLTVVKRGTLHF